MFYVLLLYNVLYFRKFCNVFRFFTILGSLTFFQIVSNDYIIVLVILEYSFWFKVFDKVLSVAEYSG